MVTKVSDLVIDGAIESQFAQDHATTTGLTYGYKAGIYNDGQTYTRIPAGTIALTASVVNDIYIDYSGTPVVARATVGATPTVDMVLIAQVTTGVSTITTVDDYRMRRTQVV